jgi:hypothetical protein
MEFSHDHNARLKIHFIVDDVYIMECLMVNLPADAKNARRQGASDK